MNCVSQRHNWIGSTGPASVTISLGSSGTLGPIVTDIAPGAGGLVSRGSREIDVIASY